MSRKALYLIRALLEDYDDDTPRQAPPAGTPAGPPEEEPFNARDFLLRGAPKQGEITRQNAETANVFYHRTRTYARGRGPLQARRNGRTQTWVRDPEAFRIPVKYGFRDCFYIDNRNASEWYVGPED